MTTYAHDPYPWRNPNPLVRARYWKAEARMQWDICEGLGGVMSRFPDHGLDVASDLFFDAVRKRREITQTAWDRRKAARPAFYQRVA